MIVFSKEGKFNCTGGSTSKTRISYAKDYQFINRKTDILYNNLNITFLNSRGALCLKIKK
ncbi:hypothetical protein CN552_18830 [Bacillus wiedmannii]|nr:hypothetical protein CN552_18830 [Bacillus wiedmannii]